MLKFWIQVFGSLDRPWEHGIAELLSQHRHMPSSPQGPSPATLFFRHPMRLAFEVSTMHMNKVAHTDMHIQNTHDTHGMSSKGEPLPTANSCGSPQTTVGVTMAEAKAAPVESVHGQSQNLGKLRPLFRGEQVLVKAGPVSKGTLGDNGTYFSKVLVLCDVRSWSPVKSDRLKTSSIGGCAKSKFGKKIALHMPKKTTTIHAALPSPICCLLLS